MMLTNNLTLTAQTNEALTQSKKYFSINIPKEFSISCPYGVESNTLDYSDYEIRYKDSLNYISISSYTLGRVNCSNIEECYNDQLLEWEKTINITYKIQKDRWFIISGVGKNSGRIFYMKGYYGERFYSKLLFNYPNDIKNEFEKYILEMSNSFTGK